MNFLIFMTTYVYEPSRIDDPLSLLIALPFIVAGFAILAWWARRRADL